MPQKSEHTSAFDSESLCNFLCWTAQELHGRLEHGLLAILRSARVQAIARANVPLGRGIRFTVHYASYVPELTRRVEATQGAEKKPHADARRRTHTSAPARCCLAREDGLDVSHRATQIRGTEPVIWVAKGGIEPPTRIFSVGCGD